MALRVRPMTAEEVDTIQRLAHSRTEPARTVERARIVWLASHGRRIAAIAQELRLCQATVRAWLQRFNCQGLAGLQEKLRPGRPALYTPDQLSEVVATSLTDPTTLGLPFACWTLDRLATYLHEVKGIPIKRTRINEVLLTEGLRWRTPQTWFGERVDPAFAENRGSSRRLIPHRRRVVS